MQSKIAEQFRTIFNLYPDEITSEEFVEILQNENLGPEYSDLFCNLIEAKEFTVINKYVSNEMVKSRIFSETSVLEYIPIKYITKDLVRDAIIFNKNSLHVLAYDFLPNHSEVLKVFDKELFDLACEKDISNWPYLPKEYADDDQIIDVIKNLKIKFNFKKFKLEEDRDYSKVIIEFFKYRANDLGRLYGDDHDFITSYMTKDLYNELIKMEIAGLDDPKICQFIDANSINAIAFNPIYDFPRILTFIDRKNKVNFLSKTELDFLIVNYLERFGFQRIKDFDEKFINIQILSYAKEYVKQKDRYLFDSYVYKFTADVVKTVVVVREVEMQHGIDDIDLNVRLFKSAVDLDNLNYEDAYDKSICTPCNLKDLDVDENGKYMVFDVIDVIRLSYNGRISYKPIKFHKEFDVTDLVGLIKYIEEQDPREEIESLLR